MSEELSILVIDDETRIRIALEYNLNMDGFQVYSAKDGSEGFQIAVEKGPDLILLDWMIPDMDGMEILRRLKQHPQTADIPVFMLTAKAAIGNIDEAMALGADDYITKPFVIGRLGNLLRKKIKESAKS